MTWKTVGPHLQIREGKRKISYRVRFRQSFRGRKIYVNEVLEGEFKSVKAAQKEADRLIGEAKFGAPREAKSLRRCDEIAEQLLKESVAKDDAATYAIKENIFCKHLIPWLNDNCPYASELNAETWPKYKIYKRSLNPTIALENHSKYFRMLSNRAFDLGIVSQKIRVLFNTKKEDFREKGQVISREDEAKILAACNQTWRHRAILQRDTGMRPGEVRNLLKDRVTFLNDCVLVRLLEEDTKTNRAREFLIRSTRAIEALRAQARRYPGSPYFFPMETDNTRPMDKHLNGWKSALKRAGVNQRYTPHDWRHTFATQMFQEVGVQGSMALCYALDMSLDVAREVYLHLNAEDTRVIADFIARAVAA